MNWKIESPELTACADSVAALVEKCGALDDVISWLDEAPSSAVLCTCAEMGDVLPEGMHTWPLLVVRSRLLPDAVAGQMVAEQQPFIFLDGSNTTWQSPPYLAWDIGQERLLAVCAWDLGDALEEWTGSLPIQLLLVCGDEFVVGQIEVTKQMRDDLYVASKTRHLHRWMPPDTYFEPILALLRAKGEPDDEIVLGPEGEAAFVVDVCRYEPEHDDAGEAAEIA